MNATNQINVAANVPAKDRIAAINAKSNANTTDYLTDDQFEALRKAGININSRSFSSKPLQTLMANMLLAGNDVETVVAAAGLKDAYYKQFGDIEKEDCETAFELAFIESRLAHAIKSYLKRRGMNSMDIHVRMSPTSHIHTTFGKAKLKDGEGYFPGTGRKNDALKLTDCLEGCEFERK